VEYTTPDEFARIIRMQRWAGFLQGLDGYISQAWAQAFGSLRGVQLQIAFPALCAYDSTV